ncbi:MAG: Stk1 family PASTA domain-containing Ser/Thr kinase [Candidatus Limnocylindrales bacterium]
MPEIGRVLGGRYRLLELLGEGGMATIYRANDAQLGRDVAVKVLRPEYGRDSAFVARFRQEAQSAASLSHPNIINVFDYGTDEAGPFIVMEVVEGGDLQALIRDEAPIPPVAAAQIARQIADGLSAAHERGIVHRDIKPSNVLLAPGGRAKVVDFGIARALSESQLTLPGTTLGSVHYFSPEQARGESVTASSDLYSLGLLLYEMLTGRRAFQGDTAAAVAMARLTAEPPSPSAVVPDVPAALDAIVRRALARDPAQRFPNAAALSGALQRFIEQPGAPPFVAIPAAASAVTAATVMQPTADSSPTVVSGPYAPAAVVGRPPIAQAPAYGYAAERRYVVEEEQPDRSGTYAWAAAILGLLILLAAGALVFFLLSRGGGVTDASPTPTASASLPQVPVPSLVGQTQEEAERLVEDAGLVLSVRNTEERDDLDQAMVTAQDPAPETPVDEGSEVLVDIAAPSDTVAVPDVRGLTPQEARNALSQFDLDLRNQTGERFDPEVPEGAIIETNPAAGFRVERGSQVDYVLSRGPEPSPTPTPTDTPQPTPTDTPQPTPTPTRTAQPTVERVIVGEYRCLTFGEARQRIEQDRLTVGVVTPPGAPDDWNVRGQRPRQGENRRVGFPIDLTLEPPLTGPCTIATFTPTPGP